MPNEVTVTKFLRSKHKRDNFSNEKYFCGKQQYASKKKSRKESKKSQVKLKVDWIWVQQIWIPRKAQATPGLLWLVTHICGVQNTEN